MQKCDFYSKITSVYPDTVGAPSQQRLTTQANRFQYAITLPGAAGRCGLSKNPRQRKKCTKLADERTPPLRPINWASPKPIEGNGRRMRKRPILRWFPFADLSFSIRGAGRSSTSTGRLERDCIGRRVLYKDFFETQSPDAVLNTRHASRGVCKGLTFAIPHSFSFSSLFASRSTGFLPAQFALFVLRFLRSFAFS